MKYGEARSESYFWLFPFASSLILCSSWLISENQRHRSRLIHDCRHWCENIFSILVVFGCRVVWPAQTHDFRAGKTRSERNVGMPLVSVSCSGIWWMVSKQKASLRSEQEREESRWWMKCSAATAHTTGKTSHPTKTWKPSHGQRWAGGNGCESAVSMCYIRKSLA